MKAGLKLSTEPSKENAKIFGVVERFFYFSTILGHPASFVSGGLCAFGWMSGSFKAYGFEATGLVFAIIILIAVIVAAILETGHNIIPNSLAWMTFRLKHTFGNLWRIMVWLLLGVGAYYLTVASQKTSSSGFETGAKMIYVAPDKPDLKTIENRFSADSLAIVVEMDLAAQLVSDSLDAIILAETASYDNIIANAKARAVHCDGLNHQIHKWAKGEAKQKRLEAKEAANNKEASVLSLQSQKTGLIAKVKAPYIKELSNYGKKYRANVSELNTEYQDQLQKSIDDNEALQSFGNGMGFYLVLYLLIANFLRAGLMYGSGKPAPNYTFEESNIITIRLLRSFTGIFSDKASHIASRTEATRTHLKDRSEARPFILPSGRLFVRGLSVFFLVFSAFQLPEITTGSLAQFSIVPHPWNWLLALSAVAGVVMAFYDAKKSARIQQGFSTDSAKSQQVSIDPEAIESAEFSADSQMLKNAETRMAANIQQHLTKQVTNDSAPPPMTANPNNGGKLNDEWNAYRKRVYGWWRTAHNTKKSPPTRERNLARCQDAFTKFEAIGCEVSIKGKKLSIKANG